MTHGFGTPSVAIATTPTVISTFFSHLLARSKRKSQSKKSLKDGGPGGGPEDQLSYEEGLKVIRKFLEFSSHHGVEEVQSFTAMWVPTPHWVRRETVTIPETNIRAAEDILAKHLSTYGPEGEQGDGLKLIGGANWWKVRGRTLEGEWIEMQKDYLKRTTTAAQKASTSQQATEPPLTQTPSGTDYWRYLPKRSATTGSDSVKDNSGADVLDDRVILYIHGGAFFFSSLETHRYQIQRHARKAGARAFSPAYRLSPQYPFPCALLDALASYLYLIDPPPEAHTPILPTNIIFMGDSAGAGMVISLLVLIREMGLPMPAGASLVSPWVDLTHSMPSIGGDDSGDFIPNTGFHYKPSCAWPPLTGDGVTVTMPDGTEQHFDEQIQMYCSNNLLTHPLVSPVNMGSLGGLCPLLIVGGGGELLRDEIMYIAHKAASPTTYPPSSTTLSQYPDQARLVNKYKPTKVHLQIYEGCCHVVPTLSWTRSSKYMYRACANFNIWAFTAAQKAVERKLHHERSHQSLKHGSRQNSINNNGSTPNTSVPASGSTSVTGSRATSTIDLTQPIIGSTAASAANREELDLGDLESEASSDSDESTSTFANNDETPDQDNNNIPNGDKKGIIKGIVTVSGTEPLFSQGSNIVSERVSTHGKIREFEPINEIPSLNPNLKEYIGQIHGSGAIQKWLLKRKEFDSKYSSSLNKWRELKLKDRQKAKKHGYLTRNLNPLEDNPPLCSLAGIYDLDLARQIGKSVDEPTGKQSGVVGMWMKMGAKADKEHAGGDNLGEIKENVEQEIKQEQVRRASLSAGTTNPVNTQKQGISNEPETIPENDVIGR
ncbi:uncharacterized protein L201_007985 [Kwoniella dendrophila CBS 6074]|uniref:Alpha/beta hydrolase fold-3 domain-containing protein n=1 Tax=Kwoniella dendrophila CBS 6074 TaxID=1295534 RepID=A0AAX4K5W9_9TREE